MTKTIFFDLGNVLLFFSREKMLKQIADLCQLEQHAMEKLLISSNYMDLYEKGLISSEQFYQYVAARARAPITFAALAHAASDIFQPNEEAYPFLEELKKRGTRLILLSNTNEVHFAFARAHYPFLQLFDHFILSYEVNSIKPEPRIYTRALQEALCPKEACFYTDDIPEFITAAREQGIDAEQYIDVKTLVNHLKARGFL